MNATLLKLGIVAAIVSGLHGGSNLSYDCGIVLRLLLSIRGPTCKERRAVRNFALLGPSALLLAERWYGNGAAAQVQRVRGNWGHLGSLVEVGQRLLLLLLSVSAAEWRR